jgi:hypothetical protein
MNQKQFSNKMVSINYSMYELFQDQSMKIQFLANIYHTLPHNTEDPQYKRPNVDFKVRDIYIDLLNSEINNCRRIVQVLIPSYDAQLSKDVVENQINIEKEYRAETIKCSKMEYWTSIMDAVVITKPLDQIPCEEDNGYEQVDYIDYIDYDDEYADQDIHQSQGLE